MSRITCVRLVTYTLIAPLVPAGTIAALATTAPSHEFKVDTPGCDAPVYTWRPSNSAELTWVNSDLGTADGSFR